MTDTQKGTQDKNGAIITEGDQRGLKVQNDQEVGLVRPRNQDLGLQEETKR